MNHWVGRMSRTAAALLIVMTLGCDGRDPPTAGGGSTAYELEIRWLGTAPTGATLVAFEAAFTTIRNTITAPLPPVGIPSNFDNLSDCGPGLSGHPDIPPGTINGLVVYVWVTPIDGAGGTLGSAGPCLVRPENANNIPALGVLRLDEVDVASLQSTGRLTTVVLHEMLHVMGFGTIWPDNDLLLGDNTADARFLGPRARTACVSEHGGTTTCATNVPVHSADGAGSAYAHWRESVFTNELMTPFLNGGTNPFSAMSIESLADLGYTVTLATAQAFSLAAGSFRMAGEPEAEPVRFSDPILPVFQVDNNGELKPYRRDR